MAHNLSFNAQTGRYEAFVAGKAPWHKLGQQVSDAQNWTEAMNLAGLNWTVSKRQLEHAGKAVPAWGIFRDDNETFLAAVGDKYTPLQNSYGFDFVDTLLEAENGAHYESAGALGQGEKIWCLAKIPHDFKIQGTDDLHQTYLLFATSHDMSMSSQAKLTTVRVVCQNTFNAALSGAGSMVRVKHTRDAEKRLNKAKELMSGVAQNVKTLQEKFNSLAARRMTKDSYLSVLDKIFPKGEAGDTSRRNNILSDVTRLFERNDRNAFPEEKGTAFNLLNAITEYTDHERSARITEGRSGYTQDQARAENALFGTGSALKESALEVILEATKHNPTQTQRQIFTMPQTPTQPSLLDDVLSMPIGN